MRRGENKSKNKAALAMIAFLLFAVTLATSVFAYLKWSNVFAQNEFTPDESVIPEVSEEFDKTVKNNVKVNVGKTDYTVYVRAAVVVTWKSDDNDATVHALRPVSGMDYSMSYGSGWIRGNDGFFYYKKPVDSDASTDVLIKSCTQKVAAPGGYHLDVQIIAQTVQAAGTTDENGTLAVTDAWGAVLDDNGNITSVNN